MSGGLDDDRFEWALRRAKRQMRSPLGEGLSHAKTLAHDHAAQYRDLLRYVDGLHKRGLDVPAVALERLDETRRYMENAADQLGRAHDTLGA